jgi:hypothetical protein
VDALTISTIRSPVKIITQLNALIESAFLERKILIDRLSFGSEIAPISADELREELKRRTESRDPMEVWPMKFLHRYLDSTETDQDSLELAIRCTPRPNQLQHFLFRVYARHFRDAHASVVEEFREFCQGAELIAAHVSCQARQALASASAASFGECEKLRHLVVIGQQPSELPGHRYIFEPLRGILTVPAPDNYESLALKMAMLFRFLGFSGNVSCVMKLDDDVRCVRGKFSLEAAIRLSKKYDYAGKVNNLRINGVERWWHLGKCQDNNLNRSPYSLIADGSYAMGRAYFLSSRAINALARSSVYLCQVFQQELYEDIAVGKVLQSFGIKPHHYNALRSGIFISTD